MSLDRVGPMMRASQMRKNAPGQLVLVNRKSDGRLSKPQPIIEFDRSTVWLAFRRTVAERFCMRSKIRNCSLLSFLRDWATKEEREDRHRLERASSLLTRVNEAGRCSSSSRGQGSELGYFFCCLLSSSTFLVRSVTLRLNASMSLLLGMFIRARTSSIRLS